MLCKSFLPIINKHCTILILGSMPGIKSLTDQEYYAHPKNRFWSLMQTLLTGKNELLTYAKKKQLLLQNQIALWDTLAHCERNGSLDSNI
ncbi:MAG: DNA-deoxyinosine glycosylase, partial [Phascolarctobacterium sp.]|nr:DNA-deoxyinosine glycosylase [Candidatus Phascolarctobacterium caballi]